MQSLEKKIEKQLIIRAFEPNLEVLKQTAKEAAMLDDITLNLYGQCGEVLVVITVRAIAEAAATEKMQHLTERFQRALGDCVYGTGKGSLAYFTAGELMQNDCLLAAADAKTGAVLAEEFARTKRAGNVFDFGDSSYQDSRVAGKIKEEAAKHTQQGNLPQSAAARATAAAKCAHADVGVAMVGTPERTIYAAVYYRGYVYLRQISAGEEIGKRSALAVLEMVRRLMLRIEVPNARVFKAGAKLDWNAPIQKKSENPYLAPVIVLAILLVALALACWYFFTEFSMDDEQPAVPAASQQTASFEQQSVQSASTAASLPESIADSSVQQPDGQAQPAAAPPVGADGAVRPFAR